jgi:hypothetical protein
MSSTVAKRVPRGPSSESRATRGEIRRARRLAVDRRGTATQQAMSGSGRRRDATATCGAEYSELNRSPSDKLACTNDQ